MKFFKNLLLAISSLIITTIITFLAVSLYLRFIYFHNQVPEHDWTIVYSTYDKRYVFWQTCFNGEVGCWKKFKPVDELKLVSNKFSKSESDNQ